jgi:hypothetical protein
MAEVFIIITIFWYSQLYGASEFAALAMGSADFTLINPSTEIGP